MSPDTTATLVARELPLPSLSDLAIVETMTLREIREIVRLSGNKKMPGASFDLPRSACQTGGDLADVAGTSCSGCYAAHGPISWPNAVALHERNLAALEHPLIVPMLARLFRHESAHSGNVHERLHAVGDVQSAEHLAIYVALAIICAELRFWIPTQERAHVRRFERDYGPIEDLAPNLTVRVSMPRLDSFPTPAMMATRAFSFVSTGAREIPEYVHVCPSERQNGTCGSCRACWDPAVRCVTYPVH